MATNMGKTFEFDPQYNLVATIRGAKDPVMVGPTEHWWTTRTPEGIGTLQLNTITDHRVKAQAWGPGSEWLINQMPRLIGDVDDISTFEPTGIVRKFWRPKKFKLSRTDIIWDALIGAVFGQKVQVTKAVSSRRQLAKKFGELAPGPKQGWVLPSPDRVASMGYHDFHQLGVERKRAETLIRIAKEMPRIQHDFESNPEKMKLRLQRIPGVGAWTIGMATAAALGDPDAVPTGDFHLPNIISWNLAGEPRGTDERMLELLQPFKGHRWRVLRITKAAGGAPKYGPRLSLIDDGMSRAE